MMGRPKVSTLRMRSLLLWKRIVVVCVTLLVGTG